MNTTAGWRTRGAWKDRAVAVLVVGLLPAACSHQYIFGAHNPPQFEAGRLKLQDHPDEEPALYPIEGVHVVRRGQMAFLSMPSHEEMTAIYAGRAPQTVDAIHVTVSKESEFWTDYALTGMGVGIALGILGGYSLARNLDDDATMVPFMIALGLSGGVYGLGIGAAVGGLAIPGTTDLRYQNPAR